MFPLIRSAQYTRDVEALKNRRSDVESLKAERHLPSDPEAPAKRDVFAEEAAKLDDLLGAQDKLAATQFASLDLQARVAAAAEELIKTGVAPEDAWAAAMEMVSVLVRGGAKR